MTKAMHPAFPVTIHYAFGQSESDGAEGTTNTVCETFLAAVMEGGFAITGTWTMRTKRAGRSNGAEANALASSIVLVRAWAAAFQRQSRGSRLVG